MSRSNKDQLVLDIEELRRFEQLIAGQRLAGNPLADEFAHLLELCQRSIQHANNLAWNVEQLKTQLIETSRSLELASRIDPMTGLANRRDIMDKIEQEYSRAVRHQRTFSIILLDVDDFRLINEAYGLNVGDDVLVEMSCVLRECVRSEDVCSRWGGEEFLFLLPETPVEGALAVAQKILYAFSMTEFKVNRPGIRATVSLGVSNYQPGQSVSDCLHMAEKAVHAAKKNGKNRYVVAE